MDIEDYRDDVDKQRRYEEELAARRAMETPYSPTDMKGRMPMGCWVIIVVVAIAAVKLVLWLFKRATT